MKKKFLVISPHPDDAELSMGGTILRLKKRGHSVFMVDVTSGEPTPYGSEEKRRKETIKATDILKVDERVNLGLENRYLFDDKRSRMLLAEKIRIYRPDVIFAPYPEDVHPDHTACAKISEAARFYAKLTKVKMKGKPHYTPEFYYFFCSHLRINPSVSFYVDISKHMDEKFRSIKCYRSQFVANPSGKNVLEWVKLRDSYFGKLSRCEYAEGFYSREGVSTDVLSYI